MEKSIEIANELKGISPLLAGLEKVNVFTVPQGYFVDLDEKIATTVFLQVDKKAPFQKVPEGYFDSLSDRILSKIKDQESDANSEIRSISPVLRYLKEEKEVFDTPEGYFEELSGKILSRIKGEKSKVITFNQVKWWKYAAVAVVAGLITVSSLQLFRTNGTGFGSFSKLPAYVQLASHYKTPQQLDQGIASLTDDEIAKYLEKNTSILDDETLVKNTDTQEMPAPDDYLLDDNALNDYLQKINAASSNKNTQ